MWNNIDPKDQFMPAYSTYFASGFIAVASLDVVISRIEEI